jgi:hypothetical protein
MPEEEIGAARRSSGGLLRAAALHERGEDGEVVREEQGLGLAFYRAEGEGERAAKAVRRRFRWQPPLMARRRRREGRRGGVWVRRHALKVVRWGGEGARERKRAGRPGRRAVMADGHGRMGRRR